MFKLKYHAEFSSKFEEIIWRIEIAERGYSGTPSSMALVMDSPLTITWEQKGDDFFVPIKGSECRINIRCFENFQYLELFTSNPRQFRVSVYRQQKLYWRGYIVSDLYEEPLEPAPHEISIKAIDGFNILSGVDYIHKEGLTSLKTMIDECLAIMELDIPLIEWMLLSPSTLGEGMSMLENTYVDANRFRHTNKKISYREVLEFCLKPFLAQIFQSNGELHIRRVMSLYSHYRPPSFLASHIITLADNQGDMILTNEGDSIELSGGRMPLEPIWEDGMNLLSTAMMEIVPALRSVTVEVENPNSTNIAGIVGIMNREKWGNSKDLYFNDILNEIRIRGKFYPPGSTPAYFRHEGFYVKRGMVDFSIKFDLKYQFEKHEKPEWSEYPWTFEWGVKLMGASNWWWSPDDGWVPEETPIIEEGKWNEEISCSQQIEEFPENGTLQLFIKQPTFGLLYGFFIKNLELIFSENEEFDKMQTLHIDVNPANNIEMKIELPISHIPALNNNDYIYPLYFCNDRGVPYKLWYDWVYKATNTLAAHAARSAIALRSAATKMLSGIIYTGRYIDMNSVLIDRKNLMAGCYVNSIETNANEDEVNVELIELPNVLTKAEGGSYILDLLYSQTDRIDKVVKCGDGLLFISGNRVFYFDTVTKNARIVHSSAAAIMGIDTSQHGACFFTLNQIFNVNAQGIVVKKAQRSNSRLTAYIEQFDREYVVTKDYLAVDPDRYTGIFRLGYEDDESWSSDGNFDGYRTTGRLQRLIIGDYSICFYLTEATGRNDPDREWEKVTVVFDLRHGTYVNSLTAREWEGEIISISDFWIIGRLNDLVTIYRRDEVDLSSVVSVQELNFRAVYADQTPGEAIVADNQIVWFWDSRENMLTTLSFPPESSGLVSGVFFINMEAYIVKGNSIYRYSN